LEQERSVRTKRRKKRRRGNVDVDDELGLSGKRSRRKRKRRHRDNGVDVGLPRAVQTPGIKVAKEITMENGRRVRVIIPDLSRKREKLNSLSHSGLVASGGRAPQRIEQSGAMDTSHFEHSANQGDFYMDAPDIDSELRDVQVTASDLKRIVTGRGERLDPEIARLVGD